MQLLKAHLILYFSSVQDISNASPWGPPINDGNLSIPVPHHKGWAVMWHEGKSFQAIVNIINLEECTNLFIRQFWKEQIYLDQRKRIFGTNLTCVNKSKRYYIIEDRLLDVHTAQRAVIAEAKQLRGMSPGECHAAHRTSVRLKEQNAIIAPISTLKQTRLIINIKFV